MVKIIISLEESYELSVLAFTQVQELSYANDLSISYVAAERCKQTNTGGG